MASGGGRKRPGKHPDVLGRARRCLQAGAYLDTRHAVERKAERRIILPEIRHVLETGYHEKIKDEYKEEWRAWNYAIRGKSIDGRALRVAISFDEGGRMLIITAIDLGG